MAQFFHIHPQNPQARLIRQAAEIFRQGGVIAYPTDSSYALGCTIGNKVAMEKIRRIRQVDDDHNFTLICRDLSELSQYARVDNEGYRLLKRCTPGPYTFILAATREVPRRLQHPRKKTIGLRVPDYPIVTALLALLDQPIMSSTLIMPGESLPMNDPEEIRQVLEHEIDMVIDGGPCAFEPTSVISLETGMPVVLRQGMGDTSVF